MESLQETIWAIRRKGASIFQKVDNVFAMQYLWACKMLDWYRTFRPDHLQTAVQCILENGVNTHARKEKMIIRFLAKRKSDSDCICPMYRLTFIVFMQEALLSIWKTKKNIYLKNLYSLSIHYFYYSVNSWTPHKIHFCIFKKSTYEANCSNFHINEIVDQPACDPSTRSNCSRTDKGLVHTLDRIAPPSGLILSSSEPAMEIWTVRCCEKVLSYRVLSEGVALLQANNCEI